jgi:hypothetical protein
MPPLLAIDAGASTWHLTQSATSRATSSAFTSWAKTVTMAAVMTAAHKKPNREYFFLSIIITTPFSCRKINLLYQILYQKK